MDPQLLVDTTVTPPLPAPIWFIEFFKVLGFSLHEVPMNLWYAGIITAMILYVRGNEHGRRFSGRLMTQMPIIIALGINFGIVPLLFIQVGYAKLFYPATVLMAWFWFAVIVILIPAYYGVYVYAFGLHEEGRAMARWKQAAGWVAAVMFLTIGFLFANALSLMENWRGWSALWERTSFQGAALGTALNAAADARFWPRWLLMFGLALGTTSVWVVFDAAWFARRETPEYRLWAKDFAWRLYTLGTAWFLVAGAGYTFLWTKEAKDVMLWSPWLVFTLLTIAAPGGVWYLLWRARGQAGEIDRRYASLLALAQFGLLGINAISRQVVQNVEVREYFDIHAQATASQWSAVAVFLISFVLGVAVIVWMVRQVVILPAEPDRV